jgi:peptide/nickel transport system substrate-binding protein
MARSQRDLAPGRSYQQWMRTGLLLLLVVLMARCTRTGPSSSPTTGVSLRIGVPDVGAADAFNGTRQLVQSFATEGLAIIGEDGRPTPAIAEGWTIAPDGLSMKIRLRAGVTFQDGSPVVASTLVTALQQGLPEFMGPAFKEIDRITRISDSEIEINFHRRSPPFVLEALDLPIQKPGSPGLGTGPYMAAGDDKENEILANPTYYLGPPTIDRIVVSTYPNVRSAWADLLRDRIDVLYEVGLDALDSLTSSKNVAVFSYVRHYQYVLAFNTRTGPLRSSEVRRALVEAVDSNALIQDAFDGHATQSSGPIWGQHWAFRNDLPKPSSDPRTAAAALSTLDPRHRLRFTCLVRSDLERVGLVLKRQLEAVGVEMILQEASLSEIFQAMGKREFDAAILEVISGPSLFRPYQLWHSRGSRNPGGLGSLAMDLAFDKVRYSTNDAEYRAAVEGLQQAVVDDPPAVFLAWGERARAVSRRFDVAAEPGRDILPTLRLWRPTKDFQSVSRN